MTLDPANTDADHQRYRLNRYIYDAHALVLNLVGSEQAVLELGCSSGYLSEQMTRQGCRVVGVEIDPLAAELARKHCQEVIVGDLDRLERLPFPQRSFDVLLFADVLEHLTNPLAVLRRLIPYAREDGRFIISIPNTANWELRWELLRGRWDYSDVGLMDRTHLRFFTRRSLHELLQAAGLQIVHEDVTPWLHLSSKYQHTVQRFFSRFGVHNEVTYKLTRKWPELFAFQFILVAQQAKVASRPEQTPSVESSDA